MRDVRMLLEKISSKFFIFSAVPVVKVATAVYTQEAVGATWGGGPPWHGSSAVPRGIDADSTMFPEGGPLPFLPKKTWKQL
jgi:hypothetical protein